LDADPPAQGVKIARRTTIWAWQLRVDPTRAKNDVGPRKAVGAAVPNYRAYIIGHDGHFIGVHEFTAPDRGEATKEPVPEICTGR
jgi:hypothetical protein